MSVKRKKTKREKWFAFLRRVLIMLFILFVAAGLLAAVGWEAVSATGIVKEAAVMLADAAADVFGES